jgi:hypothetical protein
VLTASLTAYVLCYEPRAELPPSGTQRTPWTRLVEEGPKFSDAAKRRTKWKLESALRQERLAGGACDDQLAKTGK